jgi:glycosyltransferase involved in cell wall biosynthesis
MSRPVRILQLCSSLNVGGAERLVHGLVQHFDRSRFETFVGAVAVVQGNLLEAEFAQMGVPVFTIGAKNLYVPYAYRALARYVREQQIDLIHTHLTSADFVGRIVGKALGVPVVSTLNNIPEDYENQKLYRYWLERYTCGLADHIVACSEIIRQMFIKRWKLPESRTSTIVNGIVMDKFLAVPPGVPPRAPGEGPLVTTIGRLTTQKAQHLFIEAAKIVLETRPDTRFMIVGQGPREQELKELARSLGVAERVQFAGVRYDIPDVMGQSDIFVLSSAWEGLPVSGAEAMAAARATIMTDVGGVRDLFASEREGLVVPFGDARALAQSMIVLLSNDEARVAMGVAARTRVRNEFNIATVTAQYEQLFDTILARRSRARGANVSA